jgi:hypothetical protein
MRFLSKQTESKVKDKDLSPFLRMPRAAGPGPVPDVPEG